MEDDDEATPEQRLRLIQPQIMGPDISSVMQEDGWKLMTHQKRKGDSVVQALKQKLIENNPIRKLISAPKPSSVLEQLRQSRPIYWTPQEWDNIIL